MIKMFARARAALLAAVLPLALAGCGYNTLPTKDEQVKAAWAEVQNQYQRRADLIPNLVATVQGYAQQERTVLREVVEARASATQVRVDASTLTDEAAFQRYAAAQDQLSGVLGRLLAVTENYPELRSNANFMALQSQLEGTENRIGIARRDYNAAVQDFNTTVRTFPNALWAQTAHRWAKPYPTFSAREGSDRPPTVTFPAPEPPPAVGGFQAAPAH